MSKRPRGKRLFRAALVTDTHVNEREDFSASPYPANQEANGRARYVFAQMNKSGAEIAIHLGDMVNPVPELPTYEPAVQNFKSLARMLTMPLHLMPGNHDIGDKPVSWMPAGMVDEHHIVLYRRHFGKDYFSFDHRGCHFVIINSPLINTGSAEERAQRDWLESDLAANHGKRIFLFSHYPVYIRDAGEPESYDNIDEPGRSWLLGLIETHAPEAVFTAHAHNFWYDRIGLAEYYVLPSTCFVRHDYSEMYRIDGGDQKGRNDSAKLGHVTLDIFEHGHIAYYHRTYGRTLAEGAPAPAAYASRPHAKTSNNTTVFVDMRHAWAEDMVVAPSGAVDEFRRKRARNDYPLMALWEMGIRGMRVPVQDLTDQTTRKRMAMMVDIGHLFRIYCYGLPSPEAVDNIWHNQQLCAALEVVLPWDKRSEWTEPLRDLRKNVNVPVTLSRINRKDAAKFTGGRFNHLISHGFSLAECEELATFHRDNPDTIDGVQFTIMRSAAPWTTARELKIFKMTSGLQPVLYVKSTEASPAQSFEDDVDNARRFGEAAMSAIGFDLPVILDTFDDADRGYFARSGLVDRRFNPRLAAELLATLINVTNDGEWVAADAAYSLLHTKSGRTLKLSRRGDAPSPGELLCPATGARFCASHWPDGAAELVLNFVEGTHA